MLFEQILGQEHIKKHLIQSADNGRIPHAQLFVGKKGAGTLPMAIAYASYILCKFAEDSEICRKKVAKIQHPDLHFAFPVATNDQVKKHPVSDLFLDQWRTFIENSPYGSLFNWFEYIGIEKKQGIINTDEAQEINKKLSLKSYEGGFKVMIIWMAEKMNTSAANKLLKLIEEPPAKTIFILITEDEGQILKTITTRCQAIYFNRLTEQEIVKGLIQNNNLSESEAGVIAHQANGDYNKALELVNNESKDELFEQWFIVWVRAAFKARGNASVINELIEWSNAIAGEGREVQKQFLQYCFQFFRQALLLNYGAVDLVFLSPKTSNFKLEKFAPFVHSSNILAIEKELNDAQYHIERNGNAKTILLDLSIKLTRLLHTKELKLS